MEPPVYVPKSEIPGSVPASEEPAMKQLSRVRNKPARRYGLSPNVLHINIKKGLRQYGYKAQNRIMTELQHLVDKKVFTSVEACKLQPEQMKSAIRSSIFLKEEFTPECDFLKLKSKLVAGGDQQDKTLYENVSLPTASIIVSFIVLTITVAENRHVVTMDIAGAYHSRCISRRINVISSGTYVL